MYHPDRCQGRHTTLRDCPPTSGRAEHIRWEKHMSDIKRAPEVASLTRRLDHSVPDGDFAPEVTGLTRALDHMVPDGDFAPVTES